LWIDDGNSVLCAEKLVAPHLWNFLGDGVGECAQLDVAGHLRTFRQRTQAERAATAHIDVFARHAGFAPLDFLACYEMPNAIVSSEPELCVQAMLGLVEDAERLLADRGIADDALIVGLSIGSYPATYLANRIGARLCSVASADRADLAIWESPATRIIRRRAVHKGYQLSDYTDAFLGTHPAENLCGIGGGSIFVMGDHDPFVPSDCKAGLLRAIETHSPSAQVIRLNAGHFKTMVTSGRYQRRMLGFEQLSPTLKQCTWRSCERWVFSCASACASALAGPFSSASC